MSEEIHRVETEFGGLPLIMESGRLAQQANGALTVRYGETMVLVAATMDAPRPGLDFFPLLVDFEEKMYAAGKIPGSRFIRREGRPSERAILTARLIDRSIRPQFPKGALNDVQVVVTTLSADDVHFPDIIGIIGASAALSISDIPFAGPIGAVEVGLVDDEFVVNPSYEDKEVCDLLVTFAGPEGQAGMIEAEGHQVPEDRVVDALRFAVDAMQPSIDLQRELIERAGKPKVQMVISELPSEVVERVRQGFGERIRESVAGPTKADRDAAANAARTEVQTALEAELTPEQVEHIGTAFDKVYKECLRQRILEEGVRPDGRGVTDLRPLSADVGIVPRVHGSGLFSRGETQALTIATLGAVGEEKLLDGLDIEESKRFLHHYNFPPYSVGETRPMRGPGRREIGHGALAEKSVRPVLPPEDEFPYTIRLVSEIVSSNGSTSMASVCGSSLALLDAGVPIDAPVAGISTGLIISDDGDKHVILTDIQGVEDFCGDMDFKVAGTERGVTGIQLDLKLQGVDVEILAEAVARAKQARTQILAVMNETISEPRPELSPHAPRILTVSIPPEKIGLVIGPGGRTIRSIIERTACQIDVQDDGSVFVTAVGDADGDLAVREIEGMVRDVEPGEEYHGKITRLMRFGAFAEILPGKEGLIHISELDWDHVGRVEDVVNVGDEVDVKVIEIDDMGRINLSRRALLPRPEGYREEPRDRGGRGRRDDRGRGRGRDRDRDRGRGGYDRPRRGGGRDRGDHEYDGPPRRDRGRLPRRRRD